MKKIFFLLAIGSQALLAQTLNPSTFTVANLEAISNGATVNLEAGTYVVDQEILSAWSSGLKLNVIYQGPETGTAVIDASSLSNPGLLEFVQWDDLSIRLITFHNVELVLNGCNNALIDAIEIKNNQYDRSFTDKAMCRIVGGSSCTFKNSTINWTYSGWPGKGIKVVGGNSHLLENLTVKGGLRGGITMYTASNNTAEGQLINPVTNHRISGGRIKREISQGEEDHGLYLHNISHVTIDNITFEGWSDTAAGQGVKLKGTNFIEVRNNVFYDSGLIIRVANNWPGSNDHIWIHDNTLHQGNINSWTNLDDGFTINNSAIIESNTIHMGTVIAKKEDPNVFNAFNELAQKSGGVFNNCTFEVIDLKEGIANNSNTLIANNCELGLDDRNAIQPVIYPNPAKNLIHIDAEGEKYLYNLLGALMAYSVSNVIDIKDFKSGSYFIVVRNGINTHSQQIIKLP